MQTTSLLNDLSRTFSGLILLMAACHMAYAGTDHDWSVFVGKHAAVKIDGKQTHVERSLQTRLRRADAATFLPLELDERTVGSLRWLLLREASRAEVTRVSVAQGMKITAGQSQIVISGRDITFICRGRGR